MVVAGSAVVVGAAVVHTHVVVGAAVVVVGASVVTAHAERAGTHCLVCVAFPGHVSPAPLGCGSVHVLLRS